MPNAYQLRKARRIAANLTRLDTSLSRHHLAQAVALMSFEQWRTERID